MEILISGYPANILAFSWKTLNQERNGDHGGLPLPSRDYAPRKGPSDNADYSQIHILGLGSIGLGSIGLLVAHSLRRLEQSLPVSLLLHRAELVDHSKIKPSVQLVDKETGETDEQSGYECEALEAGCGEEGPKWRRLLLGDVPHAANSLVERELPIRSLALACKGPATVSAIQSVRHRITAESAICLMQNGMGQVDELNEKVFTNAASRSAYILGIVSHGLYTFNPFTAVHAGVGTIFIGIVRDCQQSPAAERHLSPSSDHLLHLLPRAPGLGCRAFDYAELVQLQLEKLVVNCVLNPLTALIDVPNGGILNNGPLSHVQRAVIAEISKVI